jgi:predicted glycosyltransferase
VKIIVDIGHPAHIHLFKHFAHEMKQKNNELIFTYRDRNTVAELLSYEGFKCISLGKRYVSKPGKLLGLLKFVILITKYMTKIYNNFQIHLNHLNSIL